VAVGPHITRMSQTSSTTRTRTAPMLSRPSRRPPFPRQLNLKALQLSHPFRQHQD
jgi:hypothetical protein